MLRQDRVQQQRFPPVSDIELFVVLKRGRRVENPLQRFRRLQAPNCQD